MQGIRLLRNDHQLPKGIGKMSNIMTLGVRVEAGFYQELKAFCNTHEIKLSTVLREGAAIYMKLAQGKTPIERRKLIRDEFLMLAMDHFMQREYPADRDALLDEAERRAEVLNVAA
jgi:hypothetical protein